MKKHTIYGPGVTFVSVDVNGTVSHRRESNEWLVSGHWQRLIQTGPSSFLDRSHVLLNEWKEMYGDRHELMPVWDCPCLL